MIYVVKCKTATGFGFRALKKDWDGLRTKTGKRLSHQTTPFQDSKSSPGIMGIPQVWGNLPGFPFSCGKWSPVLVWDALKQNRPFEISFSNKIQVKKILEIPGGHLYSFATMEHPQNGPLVLGLAQLCHRSIREAKILDGMKIFREFGAKISRSLTF